MLNLASCTALRGPAFAAPALGDTFSWDFLNRAPDRAAASKLLPQVLPALLPFEPRRMLRKVFPTDPDPEQASVLRAVLLASYRWR